MEHSQPLHTSSQHHLVTQISRGTIWRQLQNTRGPTMMHTKSHDLDYYGYLYHLFSSRSRTAQVIQTAFPVASCFSLTGSIPNSRSQAVSWDLTRRGLLLLCQSVLECSHTCIHNSTHRSLPVPSTSVCSLECTWSRWSGN